MHRFPLLLSSAFVAAVISGCGEDQTNAPVQPRELNADFSTETANRMKDATLSIDPKKAKQARGPKSK
jgi:hypothetical protein